MILAGAGSGKTRVLVERMIHLIREERVSPFQMLAVTFTNKAAGEMKKRVLAALGPVAQDLWVSTFHSSCLRILRRHAEILGYPKHFAIYDDSDQRTVIKKVIGELELSERLYKSQSVQYHINKAKNEAILPQAFPTGGEYYLTKVQEIYQAYQEALVTNEAMDFGDLILNVVRLFQNHPDILREYQEKFLHVLVDEYQDTNLCQYKLIRLLTDRHRNVCVVGDDDQSIYKFRGAEIRNILDFQKDFPDARVIRLEQNYRSTQTILNAANAVIRGNQRRMGKDLWTENGPGERIKVFGGQDEHEEALFVAQSVRRYRENFSLKDMAVFYRTNAQSRSLEDEFRRQNIPYRIFGGIRFYDRMEVKDVVAYLRVLVSPADSVSVKRILNVPARGLGKTTVQKIDAVAGELGISFWEALTRVGNDGQDFSLNKKTLTRIQSFVSLIQKIQKTRNEMRLDEFLPFLYEESGYWKMLTDEKTIEAESRKENLKELVNVASEFVQSVEEPTLEAFLDQISLASDVDELDETQDYVTLMTIHLAKGLEFPVVFLVGLEEGLFPHARSLETEEEIEEERRLCYVGMTRAKKLLHMSFAQSRRLFGSPQFNFPSRFLEEVPGTYVEMVGLEGCIDYEYAQTEAPIRKGAMVRHAVFGDGRVLGFEGAKDKLKVTIRFNSGIQKKLLFKHAHLTMLQ